MGSAKKYWSDQIDESTKHSVEKKLKTATDAPFSFDAHVPSVGIEEIDRAVFSYFKDLGISMEVQGSQRKVPVIFATGERWSIMRNKEPILDKKGTLILPQISLRRMDIERSNETAIAGSDQPLVIKKKISSKNVHYKNIKNYNQLANQSNVANSRRAVKTKGIDDYLKNRDNIYEIYVIPFPQTFVIHYELVIWTQYNTEMNDIIEHIFGSFYHRSVFPAKSDKGFYFTCIADESMSNQSNFEDFSESERMIRYSMNFKTVGYAFGGKTQEHHVRKYTSAPQLYFDVYDMGNGKPINLSKYPYSIFGSSDKQIVDGTQVIRKRKREIKRKKSENVYFFDSEEELEDWFEG